VASRSSEVNFTKNYTLLYLFLIIVIIIKYIYIVQDREKAANVLCNSYKLNRNVLSLFLNIVCVMSGASYLLPPPTAVVGDYVIDPVCLFVCVCVCVCQFVSRVSAKVII